MTNKEREKWRTKGHFLKKFLVMDPKGQDLWAFYVGPFKSNGGFHFFLSP